MYDQSGGRVWQGELDSFGAIQNFKGDSKTDCPFRYQGQYEDAETGLYYNRFRYYSPEEGVYLSQDPIGLLGGMTPYSYVNDNNKYTDSLGLYSDLLDTGMGHHIMPRSIAGKLNITELRNNNSIAWYPNVGDSTADLHKQLHRNLIDEGVPFHGSKFTGTVDDFFDKGAKAYKDIDVKGFLKIPGTDEKLFTNLTPGEALSKLQELYKASTIPCGT
jgi:RHS repeat-associated protein